MSMNLIKITIKTVSLRMNTNKESMNKNGNEDETTNKEVVLIKEVVVVKEAEVEAEDAAKEVEVEAEDVVVDEVEEVEKEEDADAAEVRTEEEVDGFKTHRDVYEPKMHQDAQAVHVIRRADSHQDAQDTNHDGNPSVVHFHPKNETQTLLSSVQGPNVDIRSNTITLKPIKSLKIRLNSNNVNTGASILWIMLTHWHTRKRRRSQRMWTSPRATSCLDGTRRASMMSAILQMTKKRRTSKTSVNACKHHHTCNAMSMDGLPSTHTCITHVMKHIIRRDAHPRSRML
eukprot:175472_1